MYWFVGGVVILTEWHFFVMVLNDRLLCFLMVKGSAYCFCNGNQNVHVQRTTAIEQITQCTSQSLQRIRTIRHIQPTNDAQTCTNTNIIQITISSCNITFTSTNCCTGCLFCDFLLCLFRFWSMICVTIVWSVRSSDAICFKLWTYWLLLIGLLIAGVHAGFL